MTSGFDARPPKATADAVRAVEARDRSHIEALLHASSKFTDEEVETALEVFDDALSGEDDYIVNVLQNEQGVAIGYECHGPTPLTEGTYDLYWIAVDPQAQKRGFGRRLLAAAEGDIARRGGRLLLIETSSQPGYASTIQFYKRNGYRLEARIRDFYRVGDDKLIFAKEIS